MGGADGMKLCAWEVKMVKPVCRGSEVGMKISIWEVKMALNLFHGK